MGGIASARTPGIGRLPPKLKSPPLFAKTRMSDAEVSLVSDDVREDKGEPRVRLSQLIACSEGPDNLDPRGRKTLPLRSGTVSRARTERITARLSLGSDVHLP